MLRYSLAHDTGKDLAQVPGIQVGVGDTCLQKGHTEFAAVLEKARQAIIDNGQYQQVLDRWDVSDAAISKVTINGDF